MTQLIIALLNMVKKKSYSGKIQIRGHILHFGCPGAFSQKIYRSYGLFAVSCEEPFSHNRGML